MSLDSGVIVMQTVLYGRRTTSLCNIGHSGSELSNTTCSSNITSTIANRYRNTIFMMLLCLVLPKSKRDLEQYSSLLSGQCYPSQTWIIMSSGGSIQFRSIYISVMFWNLWFLQCCCFLVGRLGTTVLDFTLKTSVLILFCCSQTDAMGWKSVSTRLINSTLRTRVMELTSTSTLRTTALLPVSCIHLWYTLITTAHKQYTNCPETLLKLPFTHDSNEGRVQMFYHNLWIPAKPAQTIWVMPIVWSQ